MAEVGLVAQEVKPISRSLWTDAWQRLLRNRAARASLYVLSALALATLIGPSLTGHAFDKVYTEYVRVPPSLTPYPRAEQLEPAVQRIAARMRAKVQEVNVKGDLARVVLSSDRATDDRGLAYFERTDLFAAPRITARSEDGKSLTVDVPIKHRRFLFGTDPNGRDLLTRTLVAIRISLAIGLLATGVALVIGVAYGATAGYAGGRVDAAMMRFVDVLYALPFIFFVILLVVFFGRNFILMFLAVGAIEWLDMARIVRGQTLSIRRQEYIAAAEALGVTPLGILRRHVIPNTLGPVVVYVTLLVPRIILLESFLSFLGLGVQEPMTSLGVLIAEGARGIQTSTYLLVCPAVVLIGLLSALNFLGDGLRDALDPRDR
jgi:oligopeptide transport system permease protein